MPAGHTDGRRGTGLSLPRSASLLSSAFQVAPYFRKSRAQGLPAAGAPFGDAHNVIAIL